MPYKIMMKACFVAVVLIAFFVLNWETARSNVEAVVQTNSVPSLAPEELAGLIELLADLAGERYAANSAKNEKWILTVHDGNRVRKYSDNKYMVLSLPVSKPQSRGAICTYVNQYNSLALREADELALAGKYVAARDYCQLLAHFGCSGSLVNQEAAKRLPILDGLISGNETRDALQDIQRFFTAYQSPHDFSRITRSPPQIVTNLLDFKSSPNE